MTSVSGPGGVVRRVARLAGEIRPPGDKSISHRALILAGLARGDSLLFGLNPGRDCASTREALAAVGVRFTPERGAVRVTGVDGLPAEPETIIDCGNSGTTMRLLLGVAAGSDGLWVLTGDDSLLRRPMDRVARPLAAMGARIWLRQDRLAPVAVRGWELEPIRYEMPLPSAQVKSALLLAGALTDGRTEIVESVPTRDHTERMLAHFGARVERQGPLVAVDGRCRLVAREIHVPGDISAAAFFFVAAAILPGSVVTVKNVGLNPTRSAVLNILGRMGAALTVTEDPAGSETAEPVGQVTVRHGALAGTTIEGAETAAAIDELPILAVAAALAEGTTTILNAGELRVKESDRIAAVAGGLKRLGVVVEERPDGLVIEGRGPEFEFDSAAVDSGGDHRMAMAFAVAALKSRSAVRIEGLDSAAVSDPGFFDALDGLIRGAAA